MFILYLHPSSKFKIYNMTTGCWNMKIKLMCWTVWKIYLYVRYFKAHIEKVTSMKQHFVQEEFISCSGNYVLLVDKLLQKHFGKFVYSCVPSSRWLGPSYPTQSKWNYSRYPLRFLIEIFCWKLFLFSLMTDTCLVE